MSPSPPQEHVIGRYVLCGELASGGMATVHLGRLFGPAGFSRTVAIKRLHPQLAKDRDFAAMFVDEARLAARVQHPNVVATLDVEALGDELFLVMEYVAGESLSRLSRLLASRGEGFPLPVVSSIVTGALLGLHAAHEAAAEDGSPLGIVHRDVSPQNILVGADGTARVLDFGVAKAAVRAQVTRDGQVKGKVAYMPPEQLQSRPVDRRTDVYGASVVLWEMLTMRRLFDGEHEAAVLMAVMTAEVPPPSALVPGLPPGLDAVVMRGLSRAPELRFATAHDMAAALEEVVAPASPRKVAAWLASVAGGVLERRAQKVKEVESRRGAPPLPPSSSAAPSVPSARPPPLAPPEPPSQVSTVAVTAAPVGPPPRPWVVPVAAAVAAASVAFAAALWLVRPPAPGPVPAGLASPSLPAPEEPPGAAPSAAAPSAAAPSGDAPPPAAPSSTATPAASATSPSAAAPSPAAAGTRKTTVSPPKQQVSAGCSPPYVIDSRGIRRMKPECL